MEMPDINNRLKGMRIPIDLCVKYERLAGVQPGEKPTKLQAMAITKMMVAALYMGATSYTLTAEDNELIAEEKRNNANKR